MATILYVIMYVTLSNQHFVSITTPPPWTFRSGFVYYILNLNHFILFFFINLRNLIIAIIVVYLPTKIF